MLTRHLDLPTTVTLGVREFPRDGADGEFSQFVATARLRVGQYLPLSTLELAQRTGIPATDIESKLLEWRDLGWLTYKGSRRVMLLERPKPAPGMRKALDEMLMQYEQAQIERMDSMADYTKARGCRHGIIAAYFGDPPVESCGVCDVCAPNPKRIAGKPAAVAVPVLAKPHIRSIVLRTVAVLPFPLGKSGLTKLLKGSIASSIDRNRCDYFGALAGETKSAVESAITELVELGYLERDTGEYPTLSLTPKGRAELASAK